MTTIINQPLDYDHTNFMQTRVRLLVLEIICMDISSAHQDSRTLLTDRNRAYLLLLHYFNVIQSLRIILPR